MAESANRRTRIEKIVTLQVESSFSIAQTKLAEVLGVTQGQISQDRSDPYYEECLTKYKRGRIRDLQVKSLDLVEKTIEAGHEVLDNIDAALKALPDNPLVAAGALATLRAVFTDAKDMSRWLLERTDPEYAQRLKAEIKTESAPADMVENEISDIMRSELKDIELTVESSDNGSDSKGNGEA